jgi:hypothetical protein
MTEQPQDGITAAEADALVEADAQQRFRANYEAGREPADQIEAGWQEYWGRQETPGRWQPDAEADREMEAG